MSNYGLFYSYKSIGDVLIIVFNNSLKTTRSEQKGRVTVLYNEDDIIGYNIKDVKEIVKIHSEGKIFLPRKELIEVINYILKNENLTILDIVEESGFYIGEILSIRDNLVEISLGSEKVFALTEAILNVKDKIVIAKNNTILGNGTTFKGKQVDGVFINAHICTCDELGLQGDRVLLVDKELENGKDFFSTEAK